MATAKCVDDCLHEQGLSVRSPVEKLSLLCMNKAWSLPNGYSKFVDVCLHEQSLFVRSPLEKLSLL
jgi:hypothetical protein